MKKTLGCLIVMLIASFASAQTITRCGGPANALYINWPTFHFDNCRSGNNPYEHILSPTNVGGLQVDWTYNAVSSFADYSPVLANGILYSSWYGGLSGGFVAVDARTGSLIWQTSDEGSLPGPTVANGVLYGAFGNGFDALNAETGAPIWNDPEAATGVPAVSDGLVYFIGIKGGPLDVVALNANTGTPVWRTPVSSGEGVVSSPTVVNGVLYVFASNYNNSNQNVYLALNARTGAVIWSSVVGGLSYTTPTVANNFVYFGSDDGKIYALDAPTGALAWSFDNGSMIRSSPAVANGVLYVGTQNGDFIALDAKTGAPLWGFAAGAPVYSSPAVANGVVYFASDTFVFYALDAGSGALLWQYTSSGEEGLTASPVVANGMLYQGSYTGLFAFHLSQQ